MIERLEQRRHLSATLTGNVLTIIGTTRSDDIAIAAGRETFVVHDNGTQTAFNARQVRTIRVFGLAGDDSIIVSPRLGIRCSIEAGNGNDRVGGGAGNDTIFGGRGDDTLVGNGGDDYLDAGADDDLIEDYIGFNVIHGGAGNDRGVRDRSKLGSGVESVEEVIADEWPDFTPNGETSFVVRSGRLYLVYSGFSPSISDSYEQFGPSRSGESGTFEIESRITFFGFGTVVGDFEQEWDVTDEASDGLIFTRFERTGPAAFAQTFSVPLLLPTS